MERLLSQSNYKPPASLPTVALLGLTPLTDGFPPAPRVEGSIGGNRCLSRKVRYPAAARLLSTAFFGGMAAAPPAPLRGQAGSVRKNLVKFAPSVAYTRPRSISARGAWLALRARGISSLALTLHSGCPTRRSSLPTLSDHRDHAALHTAVNFACTGGLGLWV